jgi:PncC family amidohydrolase
VARRSRAPRTRPALSLAPRLIRQANKLVAFLKRKKLTVVSAESCTGGLIAAALSQADGASDVLQGAFVTYTKAHKTKALGIASSVLKREGAVNARVAQDMAAAALKRSRAAIAIAVTGVLGPRPDDDGNPVGLVYFACATRGRAPDVLRKKFVRRSHDQLRCLAITTAFNFIAKTARTKRV